jgi:hypothetical protein
MEIIELKNEIKNKVVNRKMHKGEEQIGNLK